MKEQEFLTKNFIRTKDNKLDIAVTYFQLLSAFNNLKLSQTEINLLAHGAINNNVISGGLKIRFAEKYKTSIPVINNAISLLKKKHLLEKVDNTIRIYSKITIDINNSDNFLFSFKCIRNVNQNEKK